MTQVVDSFRLQDRAATMRFEDIGNREGNLGDRVLTVFVDLAIEEIEKGVTESENISAALSLLTCDPHVLEYAPISPANNFLLMTFLKDSMVGFPIIGNTRVIGCGVLPIEATSFIHSKIIQGCEVEVLVLLKKIKSTGIRSFSESRLKGLTPETEAIVQTYPLINGSIHFSDPVWDPMLLDETKPRSERRLEFEKSLPRVLFPDTEKVFWGRRFIDIGMSELPTKGGIFSADSVQSLRELNIFTENLFALKFDPEMLRRNSGTSSDSSFEVYANIRNALNEFYEVVLKQVKNGGRIVITLGKGNNPAERLNRRIFAVTISKLLPTSSNVKILTPEEYVGGVPGIPFSVFKSFSLADRQYLSMRMPSEMITFTTGTDLNDAFIKEIGREDFQKIVYHARRDTDRFSRLIR